MKERKVYVIPRRLDEEPKAAGIIPLDTVVVFTIFAIPFVWLLSVLKGVLLALFLAFIYEKKVKKGKNYHKFALFKAGLLEIDGACPPVGREVRK